MGRSTRRTGSARSRPGCWCSRRCRRCSGSGSTGSTVTDELVASRLARSDWIASALTIVLSMPRPNETLREPDGAIIMTLLVSPPMKKLLIFASRAPSTGVVVRPYSSASVVKFVALPPTRTSPICPVPERAAAGDHEGPARRLRCSGDRRPRELRGDQPRRRVAVDRVGLEEIQPAVDQEGHHVLERRRARRRFAWASEVMLLTITLVPLMIGRPRSMANSLLCPVWFSGVPPDGV